MPVRAPSISTRPPSTLGSRTRPTTRLSCKSSSGGRAAGGPRLGQVQGEHEYLPDGGVHCFWATFLARAFLQEGSCGLRPGRNQAAGGDISREEPGADRAGHPSAGAGCSQGGRGLQPRSPWGQGELGEEGQRRVSMPSGWIGCSPEAPARPGVQSDLGVGVLRPGCVPHSAPSSPTRPRAAAPLPCGTPSPVDTWGCPLHAGLGGLCSSSRASCLWGELRPWRHMEPVPVHILSRGAPMAVHAGGLHSTHLRPPGCGAGAGSPRRRTGGVCMLSAPPRGHAQRPRFCVDLGQHVATPSQDLGAGLGAVSAGG